MKVRGLTQNTIDAFVRCLFGNGFSANEILARLSKCDGAGVQRSLIRLERETGVEPATSSLGSWHSTTELLPLSGGHDRSISQVQNQTARRARAE